MSEGFAWKQNILKIQDVTHMALHFQKFMLNWNVWSVASNKT